MKSNGVMKSAFNAYMDMYKVFITTTLQFILVKEPSTTRKQRAASSLSFE